MCVCFFSEWLWWWVGVERMVLAWKWDSAGGKCGGLWVVVIYQRKN